jgi:hypothetical protein
MTLALAHGENSRPEFRTLGRDLDVLQMQGFYDAYELAADGFYRNWWEFSAQVRSGHIVCVLIVEEDYKSALGIELMRDKHGPYINPMFYTGRLTRRLIRELVFYLFMFLQHYKQEQHFGGFGRVFLGGRSGWQALAFRLGLRIDPEGFVSEDQETLRHGIFKRLN